MKTIEGPSVKKIYKAFLLMAVLFIMIICCGAYRDYDIYQSIDVKMKKTASIEYGSSNYNIKKLIKEVDGKVVSVKQDVDTSVLGAQEVILEVKKNNMVKDIPVIVNVVDTSVPTITLKNEKMSITDGDSYNLCDNIESVLDNIDGELPYVEGLDDNRLTYYNFRYEGNINDIGEHIITVYAVDSSGNIATSDFVFEVEERKVYKVFYNLPPNPSGNNVVSIAYSLLGLPYTYGGRGPYAFDCSGFVHYVYSQIGVNISSGSYAQQFVGQAVSYENAQPGDILIWGYVDGQPTHSALYIGNGQMIHAANYNEGVILSDVNYWLSGSGTHILTVRRL